MEPLRIKFVTDWLRVILALSVVPSSYAGNNGFDLSNAIVAVKHIRAGGPPRDGIPAINNPVFVQPTAVNFLKDDERVLGVTVNEVSRAYPIKILNWHEVVNDRIGRQNFVVSYCPLCGSGMVFATNIAKKALIFGVSGLLYESDMLLYDRYSQSLWSQIKAQAISGKLVGTKLPQIPALHTTWSNWRSTHPNTMVLSNETGYRRNYNRSPYAGYEKSRRLYFEVSNKAPNDYHPKMMVLGVEVENIFKAYPFEELAEFGSAVVVDRVGGRILNIHYNAQSQSAYATSDGGEVLPSTMVYWFAWYTFHPDTRLYKASE